MRANSVPGGTIREGALFFQTVAAGGGGGGTIRASTVHEIGVEKKYRYHASFVCVRFSKGGGVGEKRLVFVSKKISVFTDDPLFEYYY